MSKAIDPFEEFLRKKKVKMLEEKFRRERAAEEGAADVEEEEDARIQEEVDDFFESGQSAGAELFSKVQDLSDDKVEEIKDALEDVFEKEAATPHTEEVPADEPFVRFFKKVQNEFDDEAPAPPAAAEPAAPAVAEPPPAAETKPPPPAATEPPPPAATKPPPAAKTAPRKKKKKKAEPPKPAPAPADAASRESIAVEISSHEPADEPAQESSGRLNLVDMLLAGNDASEELERRIEVLCRLVAKLVERTELPESEIVEALIKSGVEF
jgi:hypothetical protein